MESCTAIEEVDLARLVIETNHLWLMHYQETTIKFGFAIKPNLELYKALEEKGRLFCLVVRHEGVPVGYSVNFLASNLHHMDFEFVKNDMIYVLPVYRKKIGLKLFRETVKRAKTVSKTMIWTSKEGSNFEKVLKKVGCVPQETSWSMALG
jgi:hypothetical protein